MHEEESSEKKKRKEGQNPAKRTNGGYGVVKVGILLGVS
jgi:hypothetical protein